MINSSDMQWGSRTWWAGLLSMVGCLGALIGSASLERLPASPAIFAKAEVGLRPLPGAAGDPLNHAAAEVQTPLVRSLIKELIAERLVDAQFSADLEISTTREEPAHREARLPDTTATRAEIESGFVEQLREMRKASVQARRQGAATKNHLQERERQLAHLDSEAEDPRPRVDAAYTELERKRVENNGLSTEPASVGTSSVTVTTPTGPVAIEGQSRLRHAAAGDTAPASNAIDNGGPVRAGKIAVVEDDTSTQPSSLEIAVSNSEPMAARATSATPAPPAIQNRRSTAVLALAPFPSSIATPGENGATNGSAGPLQGGDPWFLNEATARLADGLRVTREEAISRRQERVFTVDVEKRAFIAASTTEPVSLDRAFNIHLVTAKSELVGKDRGGIRFFADGSSTGGRIELELLGERTAINVQWATGVVTVER